MFEHNSNPIIKKSLERLEIIEKTIQALKREKEEIELMVLNVRKGDIDIKDVTRKNSINRVLIEKIIINEISKSKSGVKTSKIMQKIKEIDLNFNKNTFRSHLNRLKERGVIEKSKDRGYWKLSEKKSSHPSAQKTTTPPSRL